MKKFNRNVEQAMKKFKESSSCCVCGYKGNFASMVFHHVDADLKGNEISKIIRGSDFYVLIIELRKCTLICANCHLEYHNTTVEKQLEIFAKFKATDVDYFLEVCMLENAIVSNLDEEDIYDRIQRLEAENIQLKETIHNLLNPVIPTPSQTNKYVKQNFPGSLWDW